MFSSSSPPKDKSRLHPREWVFIALILGFLGATSLISHYSQIRQKRLVDEYVPHRERTLEIVIEGAVEKPGTYECRPGTPLKNLLDQAQLQEKANRRKVRFKKVLFSSQTIRIEEKKGRSQSTAKFSLEEN